jgi:hypothetical protein
MSSSLSGLALPRAIVVPGAALTLGATSLSPAHGGQCGLLALAFLGVFAMTRIPPLSPMHDLSLDVARRRHHRRAALQLSTCFDDAGIEVGQGAAHGLFRGGGVELCVEGRIFGAQCECGRAQARQPLPLDLLTDPPVRIVGVLEPGQWFTRAGQVVEVASAHGLLDRNLHDLRSLLHGGLAGIVRVFDARVVCFAGGLQLADLITGNIQSGVARLCRATHALSLVSKCPVHAVLRRGKFNLRLGKVRYRLTSMESNLSTHAAHPQNDVTALLGDLETDRAELAQRLRKARWFAPTLGALAAIYVATPALPDTINRGFVGTSLVILGVIVTTGYQRATGVKLLRFRAFELLLFAAALLATLFFFSVSLGLAASGLPWWIVASVAASFAVATGLAHLVAASMQRRVRDAA